MKNTKEVYIDKMLENFKTANKNVLKLYII